MKTREWQKYFTEQARMGKTLFTITELANAAGSPRRTVNVELSRLVKYGVVARYARGLYGQSRSVAPEALLQGLDPFAYITGAYALMEQGLITQAPARITCFTTRRHYNRELQTPAGRFEFVCVKPPVYCREIRGRAGPEQALCDFIYIALRRRLDPASMVSFRRLATLKRSSLARVMKRYPATVARYIADRASPSEWT